MRKIQKHITNLFPVEMMEKVRFIMNGYEPIIKSMAVSSARLKEFDFGQFYNFIALLACKKDSEDFDNEILYPLGEYQIEETGETDGNVETFAAEVQDMVVEILEEQECAWIDEPDDVGEFRASVDNLHPLPGPNMAQLQAVGGWHHVQPCATVGAAVCMSLN